MTNIRRAATWFPIPNPNRPQSLTSRTGHKDNAGWMSHPSRVDRTAASYIIPGLQARVRNSRLLHTLRRLPSSPRDFLLPSTDLWLPFALIKLTDGELRFEVCEICDSLASPHWVWPSGSRQLNFHLENGKSVLVFFWPSSGKMLGLAHRELNSNWFNRLFYHVRTDFSDYYNSN